MPADGNIGGLQNGSHHNYNQYTSNQSRESLVHQWDDL